MDYESFIKRAVERRRALFEVSDTDCFRLVNGEADGLPGFTLDRFGDFLLAQVYDEALLERRDENITLNKSYIKALSSIKIPVSVKGILVKNREKLPENNHGSAKRKSFLIYGEYPPPDFAVMQNGVRLFVDLIEGQDTGIFLDMREIRNELAGFYKTIKGRMLNLFCYTGMFSIHAIKNGLAGALNVDLSASALERAKKNYELNDIVFKNTDFIRGDAAEWPARLAKKGFEFGIVVIDPPTFSRNKKKNFSVKENYGALLSSLAQVAPSGYVFSSVNALGISKKEFLAFHPRSRRLVFYRNESSDFSASGVHYLKAALWKVE